MKSFAEHYPLPLFQALQKHAARYPRQEDGKYDPNLPALNEWTEGLKSHEQAIDSAIIAFLLDLRNSRFLSEVQPMYKRTHRLAQAWNAFVKGTCASDQMDRIREYVSRTLFRYSLVTVHKDLEASYKALVERADGGDLPWYFTESQEECQTTGERLHVEWYEWLPRLGTQPEKAFRDCLIPAREIGPASVAPHEIQAPSGELLLADWFRIPGFHEAVEDPAAKAYEYSINNDVGKLRQAQWYARQHGFASVFVGNSSPQVLVRERGKGAGQGGHVLLAQVDEDNRLGQPPAIGKFAGRVCTDLWWMTIIDREVLSR